MGNRDKKKESKGKPKKEKTPKAQSYKRFLDLNLVFFFGRLLNMFV